MEQLLELTRIFAVLTLFIYTSWKDYKTREVSNRVWLISAPPLFAVTLLQLVLYSPSLWSWYLFSIGFTSIISTLLFYMGVFGGADAKALMVLALAMPFHPTITQSFAFPSLVARVTFPLAVLTNAALFGSSLSIYYFTRNLLRSFFRKQSFFIEIQNESFTRKVVLALTGYPTPFKNLYANEFLLPLEKVEEKEGVLTKTVSLRPNLDEREAELEKLAKVKKPEDLVWVTPGLPFLVFILLGLLFGLLATDVFAVLFKLFNLLV